LIYKKVKKRDTLICENVKLLPSVVPVYKLEDISKDIKRKHITLLM
jgi:hypothetical protein